MEKSCLPKRRKLYLSRFTLSHTRKVNDTFFFQYFLLPHYKFFALLPQKVAYYLLVFITVMSLFNKTFLLLSTKLYSFFLMNSSPHNIRKNAIKPSKLVLH